MTPDLLRKWTIGTLSQRFSAATWARFLNYTVRDLIGHANVIFGLALAGIACSRSTRRAALVWGLLFVIPLVCFTNLHIVHNYYAHANGLFLIIAAAVVVAGLIDQGGRRGLAGLACLGIMLGIDVRSYLDHHYISQIAPQTTYVDIARQVAAATKPDDVIVIIGDGWNPELAYLAGRRAVMNAPDYADDDPRWQAALAAVGNDHIGARVLCSKNANCLLTPIQAASAPPRDASSYPREATLPGQP